ncbi:YbjQ family protein [Tenacibaculum amylolyticum]|uniref:YbjQ family protein n=1 Tax=Tenacibaculum amylolyticum TaxID=104269 RepID=UPI003894D5FD
MILTTTNSIEGHKIIEYKGIVTGISYNSTYDYKGKNISFSDLFNTKKRFEAYEVGIENIKEGAFQKLQENAVALNADAVVGIKVDIETIANSTILLVSVTGTAVKISL